MMHHLQTAVLAAAACAAGIPLAACSVTTTAGPASGSARPGSTVSVSAPLGRFPVPQGAQVIEDSTGYGHSSIVFGSVSPSRSPASMPRRCRGRATPSSAIPPLPETLGPPLAAP
jgi:hypothetical protein